MSISSEKLFGLLAVFIAPLIISADGLAKNSDKKIVDAVIQGNALEVKKLLDTGADVNQRDSSGASLILIATGLGNKAVFDALIEHNADIFVVDAKMGVTPLHRAAQSGNVEIVRKLLTMGSFIDDQSAVNGHTPLLDAAFYKRYEVFEYLLKSNANTKLENTLGLTVSDWAKRQKDPDLIRLLKEQEERDAARASKQQIISSAKTGDLLEVKKAIAGSADVNQKAKDGMTALLWASRNGHTEIVKELLKAGANPNETDKLMKATSGHKAAFFGHDEILKHLIKHGLKLDAQGPYNGYTALHDALLNSHIAAAKTLMQAGAATDIQGIDGKTAISIAKEVGIHDHFKW